MNLRHHFGGYRRHLSSTALHGCEAYAKSLETKDMKTFPTAASFLAYQLGQMQDGVDQMNPSKYCSAVKAHQRGMLCLFRAMVKDELWDFRMLKANCLLRMAKERGWLWFRYAPVVLEADLDFADDGKESISVVPTYGEEFSSTWRSGKIVFDAQELEILNRLKNLDLNKQVLLRKKQNPSSKFLEDGTFSSTDEINSQSEIIDWALPLGV